VTNRSVPGHLVQINVTYGTSSTTRRIVCVTAADKDVTVPLPDLPPPRALCRTTYVHSVAACTLSHNFPLWPSPAVRHRRFYSNRSTETCGHVKSRRINRRVGTVVRSQGGNASNPYDYDTTVQCPLHSLRLQLQIRQ
jgi:hypothetical protein